MPGAELQLVLQNAKTRYFTGNPQISFFRTVYRRHTNFAMETLRIPFAGTNSLSMDLPTTLRLKIKPIGDLIKDLFLSFELPDIYSDEIAQFQWIRNIGSIIIQRVRFFIGGQVIQDFNGEYIYIQNQINQPFSKDAVFNRITGNLPELYDPKAANPVWGLYPAHSRGTAGTPTELTADERFINTGPSIRGRRIYLPIPFWFSTNVGNALPLVALQFQEISVEIELRPLRELYTIRKVDPNTIENYGYWNGFDISITTDYTTANNLPSYQNIPFGVRQRPIGNSTDDLYAFFINGQKFFEFDLQLEARYIFLDIEERNRFKLKPHSYLLRQLDIVQNRSSTGSVDVLVNLNKPVEEVIFFARRDDLENNNQWTNFTNFPKEGIANVSTYYNNAWNYFKSLWDQGYRYVYINTSGPFLYLGYGPGLNNFPYLPAGEQFIYYNAFSYYSYLFSALGPVHLRVYTGIDWKLRVFFSKIAITTPPALGPSSLPSDKVEFTMTDFNWNERISAYFTYRVFNEFREIWEYYLPNTIPIINNTNYQFYDENIFEDVQIYFDGYLREKDKPGQFFNLVEQYKFHLRSTDKGINIYSFSLDPGKPQPAGSCPFNNIREVKFRLKLKTPPIIGPPLQPGLNAEFLYSYNVNFFLISLNVLNIMNGLGGLLYTEN
jgi:hypothetical protein